MLELESTKNLRLSATTLERGSRSKLNLLHDSDFGIIEKEIIYMADFKGNNKRNNNNGKKNYNNNRNNSNYITECFKNRSIIAIFSISL